MTKKEIQSLGKSIGTLVGTDRKGVLKILRQNNIPVSNNVNNKELISIIFNKGLDKSKFVKDLKALVVLNSNALKNLNVNINGAYNNTVGDTDVLQDHLYNNAKGTDWGGLAGNLVGTFGNVFGAIQISDAEKKLAEAQAQISANETAAALANNQTQLELAKIELAKAKLAGNQPAKNNTMLYVGLGLVGILVITGIIVIAKK